jgi:hypothetical protein
MDWIAAGIMLFGNVVLIRNKTWKAFAICLLGNFLYAIYWFTRHEWATLGLVMIFSAQNLWGIISWRKQEKK